MNQRIKQLAEQARKYARDYVAECKHYGHYMEHNEYELRFEEKFAVLIVQECCDWIEGSPTSESGCQLLLTKSFIIANLKGHFGV